MSKDVLPELLQAVQSDFESSYGKSEVVRKAFEALKAKKATYLTVNDFAIEIGEILSKALKSSVSADKLPDGKMYYNIAKRLLEETLGRNYELVSQYASDVQGQLNKKANIHLKTQEPGLNQDRIDGIVNRISSEQAFDDVQWILQEPIVNFTQSIVDDFIEENAKFHRSVGLEPTIERRSTGHCCDWCQSLVGFYLYGKEPANFYRRHQHCRCTIDYDPKNGKKQNSWSKKWHRSPRSKREDLKQQRLDVKDNFKADDKREFKRIKAVLGRRNGPISLAKFQEMKYNDSEKYERLMDKVFIKEKFQSGAWLDKVNPEKQTRHIQGTAPEGKSYFYDDVDVQALYDKYKMSGRLRKNRDGSRTFKENIDLPAGRHLGIDIYTGKEINGMTIHYSKTGVHIVPIYYKEK